MNAGGTSNHFDLIPEAQRTSGKIDFSDIPFGTEEFDHDKYEPQIISDISESGILTIVIVPDFYSVRHIIQKNAYRTNDNGVREKTGSVLVGNKSKFTPHKYYHEVVKKSLSEISKGVGRNFIPKTSWKIEVGFLQSNSQHVSPGCSKSYSIAELIAFLLALGYDPLLVIRKDAFIKSARTEMARIIVEAINANNVSGSRLNIRRKLELFAKHIADFAKDYIHGGAKPDLSDKTISNRKSKQNRGLVSYTGNKGINEPLSETQQLEAEVGYRVTGDSEWVSDWKKEKEDTSKRIANAVRKSNREENILKSNHKKNIEKLTRIKDPKKRKIAEDEMYEIEMRDAKDRVNRTISGISPFDMHGGSVENISEIEKEKKVMSRYRSHIGSLFWKYGNEVNKWPKNIFTENESALRAYFAAKEHLRKMGVLV